MPPPNEPIIFEAEIERIAPEVPRYIVYAGKAWDETGTFVVDVAINDTPIGLRNLMPWKERGWHFGLSQPMCRRAGVETGDRVRVQMTRPSDTRPPELRQLIEQDARARQAWESLPAGDQRDAVLFVAAAKQPETRMRRAQRILQRTAR